MVFSWARKAAECRGTLGLGWRSLKKIPFVRLHKHLIINTIFCNEHCDRMYATQPIVLNFNRINQECTTMLTVLLYNFHHRLNSNGINYNSGSDSSLV